MLQYDLSHQAAVMTAVNDFVDYMLNLELSHTEFITHLCVLIPAFKVFDQEDKGYPEIYAVYPNSLLSLKAKKRCKPDPELKKYNQKINKRRMRIEHVFGSLKTFKILSDRY